jgi:hypothetical protein
MKNAIKAILCAAIIAIAICLGGCVSVGPESNHWWGGLTTNGIGYAHRIVSTTNGVPWTNSFGFKVTVPFNISGAIGALFQGAF